MAFIEPSDESISGIVDNFFREQYGKAAQLTMALGSLMVPGMVPRMSGAGNWSKGFKGGKIRPTLTPEQAKKLEGAGEVTEDFMSWVNPKMKPGVNPPPKQYTRTVGQTSEHFADPVVNRVRPGRNMADIAERRSAIAEIIAERGAKPVTDPVEWLQKRAFAHFNKLTPAERSEAGLTHWSDLVERWTEKASTTGGLEEISSPEMRQMLIRMLAGE